jgi:aryl-alcohol dehydrogenase-like predicted oxidoreductase
LGPVSDEITAGAAGMWTLGDLTVNRMGFGAMRLTRDHDGTPSDRDRVIGVVRRAVELGVNHIDTAGFYFDGPRSANEILNRALYPYPEGLVITTKVAPVRDRDGEWLELARPEQLRGHVEENLRQLGRDHMDVVNLRTHGLDSIAEHFGALARLRDEGLIRHLGISNVRLEHLQQALEIAPVVCVQNIYGLDVGRGSDDILRICGERGIAFVPFFSIAGPGRNEGGVAATGAVEAVARARGLTPAQVRLAWTLHQGSHVLAIPGTGNPDHLDQNIAAGAVRLSIEELTAVAPVG